MGVTASIADPLERLRPYQLRVWGQGVNERRALSAFPRLKVMLASRPRATDAEYFAQLETTAGTAVSQIVPLRTRASCQENLVALVFDRRGRPTP
jgi:hypothetical protein